MAFKYTDDEVKKNVGIAIGILFKNDYFLLENDVHERSVAHKLAEYLQIQFLDWDVDSEYNLKGLDTKQLDGIRQCSTQRATDRVLPDIIIHKRNTNNNLLVVEIKTNNQNDACDVEKLKLFTADSGDYKYVLGLFIKFNRLDEPSMRWFKNGV
jgi:hypothetical protein